MAFGGERGGGARTPVLLAVCCTGGARAVLGNWAECGALVVILVVGWLFGASSPTSSTRYDSSFCRNLCIEHTVWEYLDSPPTGPSTYIPRHPLREYKCHTSKEWEHVQRKHTHTHTHALTLPPHNATIHHNHNIPHQLQTTTIYFVLVYRNLTKPFIAICSILFKRKCMYFAIISDAGRLSPH